MYSVSCNLAKFPYSFSSSSVNYIIFSTYMIRWSADKVVLLFPFHLGCLFVIDFSPNGTGFSCCFSCVVILYWTPDIVKFYLGCWILVFPNIFLSFFSGTLLSYLETI